MQNITQKTVTCTSCMQATNINIYSYIDATQDVEGKTLLVTGRLNSAYCPNCGAENVAPAPLLYHDPSKELLLAYIPMELNISNDAQERIIGELMNAMPKENFKGYMFNPRRALTMKNLIEQILEADGVTPEMMEQQRERIRLVQEMMNATEEELEQLIEDHDEEIDMQFFQTISMIVQRELSENHQQIAQEVAMKQNFIAEKSTYGQELLRKQEEREEIAKEIANTMQGLTEETAREEFFKMVMDNAGNEDYIQVLVSIARPAFDYEFFQQLTETIEQVAGDEKDELNTLRERILESTTAIDQQTQMMMQQAAQFLQAVVNHPEPEQLLRVNAGLLDDAFMAVLGANIQQAEKDKDIKGLTRLKEVYRLVTTVLQENMQPELLFVNNLLSADSTADAKELLREHGPQFQDSLMEVFDAVEQALISQKNEPLIERIQELRQETEKMLT
jgi:hypothetical protein